MMWHLSSGSCFFQWRRSVPQMPANRTAAENGKLRALLGTARTELRFGQALGYATEKDMSDLIAAVDQIDRKTSGQQHGTGLLDRIRGLFEHARQASQPQQGKP